MSANLIELSQREYAAFLNGLALVSQVFWGPEPAACQEMTTSQYLQDLTDLDDLLDELDSGPPREMALYLTGFKDPEELAGSLEQEYLPLFINNRGGITAPLYQSCYENTDGSMMGRPAVMMRTRLEQAGLSLEGPGQEPPDHLAVELEYLFIILEAALQQDDPRLLSEARKFAGKEMLPWVGSFKTRLDDCQGPVFYPAAAGLAHALVKLAAG